MMDWLKKRTPLGRGQKAAIADYARTVRQVPRTVMVGVDEDTQQTVNSGSLPPIIRKETEREPRQAWDDDAEEGVDYDVVTRSLTFSAQTRAQHMIDALLAAHDEVASQPEVLSFSIEVGAVDDRAFADPAVRQHIFIEASMDGRRGR